MKVVEFESEFREAPVFERLRPTHDLNLVAEPLGAANVERHAEAQAISTFIYSKVSREVLERLPALKLIATHSTGYDHIDLAYCAELGIAVANIEAFAAGRPQNVVSAASGQAAKAAR